MSIEYRLGGRGGQRNAIPGIFEILIQSLGVLLRPSVSKFEASFYRVTNAVYHRSCRLRNLHDL